MEKVAGDCVRGRVSLRILRIIVISGCVCRFGCKIDCIIFLSAPLTHSTAHDKTMTDPDGELKDKLAKLEDLRAVLGEEAYLAARAQLLGQGGDTVLHDQNKAEIEKAEQSPVVVGAAIRSIPITRSTGRWRGSRTWMKRHSSSSWAIICPGSPRTTTRRACLDWSGWGSTRTGRTAR
jgi:hypothetical protein